MSEYQYVQFLAIDRPLNDEQMAFMQKQSTRATISRREFSNEYHFGDFRGKALEMMRRGFDLHLHFANFGIRKLMFRLPGGLPCSETVFKRFTSKYQLEWHADTSGTGGVLEVQPESDGGRWDGYVDNLEDLLTELTPVREMLVAGDLRPLYLAWLACYPDKDKEPPVPAGLKKLPKPLKVLVDFYELDCDLLQTAAEESADMAEQSAPVLPIQTWLKKKNNTQRTDLLEQLLRDESGRVRADAMAEIRASMKVAEWPVTETSRTIDELRTLADRKDQIRREKEAVATERKQRKRLKAMKEKPAETVDAIMKLVSQRSTQKHTEAIALLSELRDVLGPDDGPPFTQTVAQQIRQQKPAPRGLIAMLKNNGFLK